MRRKAGGARELVKLRVVKEPTFESLSITPNLEKGGEGNVLKD